MTTKKPTKDEVDAATARFIAAGGEIDRTPPPPVVDCKGKSYGELAVDREKRRKKREKQGRI